MRPRTGITCSNIRLSSCNGNQCIATIAFCDDCVFSTDRYCSPERKVARENPIQTHKFNSQPQSSQISTLRGLSCWCGYCAGRAAKETRTRNCVRPTAGIIVRFVRSAESKDFFMASDLVTANKYTAIIVYARARPCTRSPGYLCGAT